MSEMDKTKHTPSAREQVMLGMIKMGMVSQASQAAILNLVMSQLEHYRFSSLPPYRPTDIREVDAREVWDTYLSFTSPNSGGTAPAIDSILTVPLSPLALLLKS
jgi:hypothetical protein